MKINSSIEQGVYVLIMLALQRNHTPVKSHILSANLGVSDSYLKKILMKMARHGLVVSAASRQGGYQLAKTIDQITLKDVFAALDQEKQPIAFKGLAQQVFDSAHVSQGEEKVNAAITQALTHFYDDLGHFSLSELLEEEEYREGHVDWEKLAATQMR